MGVNGYEVANVSVKKVATVESQPSVKSSLYSRQSSR